MSEDTTTDYPPHTPKPKRRRRTNAEILAAGGRSAASQRNNDLYNNNIEIRVRRLINTYKSQDTQAGRGLCDLDPNEMLERVRNQICEVTGATLDLSPVGGGGQRKKRAFSFSFDRLDNRRPHTRDNVRVVCGIYNIMRGNYPQEEVERFIEVLREPVRAENARLRQALLAVLAKCMHVGDGADLILQECQELAQKALYSD